MRYRQTFVIEYPKASDAPSVSARMEALGGKLVACQFNDALQENATLREALEVVVRDWTQQFERAGHLAPGWVKQARAALAA